MSVCWRGTSRLSPDGLYVSPSLCQSAGAEHLGCRRMDFMETYVGTFGETRNENLSFVRTGPK